MHHEDRDIRQRDIVPPDQLAAAGVPWLQLIDPDTVEPVNLACQGYLEDDLGRSKVSATADLCQQLHDGLAVEELPHRFRRSMAVGNVLFCAVDSIETRRLIWEAVKDRIGFFAEGRMTAEVLRVLVACDPHSREHYPTTLFATNEEYTGSCTARSTIFCANIAAGFMVAQFARWLRRLPIDAELTINLLASELTLAPAST